MCDRAREGNEHALDILHRMGRRLGSAFGSFVNVFNPELIVVGGTLSAERAFELGFDHIWVYDHVHNVPRPTNEAVFDPGCTPNTNESACSA